MIILPILLSKIIMVNVARKAPFNLIGSIIVIAISLYLFPCISCHDDCCEDSMACDTLTCLCSCGVSVAGTDKYFAVNGLDPSERAKPYYFSHKPDDLPFEFYRPPERQSS